MMSSKTLKSFLNKIPKYLHCPTLKLPKIVRVVASYRKYLPSFEVGKFTYLGHPC